MTSETGTPLFSCPSLLRRERYDERADQWSFACLIEVVATHEQPYSRAAPPTQEVVSMVAREEIRPSLPGGEHGPFGALLPLQQACSDFDATARPRFELLAAQLQEPKLEEGLADADSYEVADVVSPAANAAELRTCGASVDAAGPPPLANRKASSAGLLEVGDAPAAAKQAARPTLVKLKSWHSARPTSLKRLVGGANGSARASNASARTSRRSRAPSA